MPPLRLLALALLLPALALAAPPRAAGDPVTLDDFDPGLLAREIFRAVNVVRARHDLAPFKAEPKLDQAAEGQAVMLSLSLHVSHENPLPDQGSPAARVHHAGLPEGSVAENAAMLGVRNPETGRACTYAELATALVQAWMDSPGHRANLLDPHLHYLGCGTRLGRIVHGEVVVYAIQDFYTPPSRRQEPIEVPVTEILPSSGVRISR